MEDLRNPSWESVFRKFFLDSFVRAFGVDIVINYGLVIGFSLPIVEFRGSKQIIDGHWILREWKQGIVLSGLGGLCLLSLLPL